MYPDFPLSTASLDGSSSEQHARGSGREARAAVANRRVGSVLAGRYTLERLLGVGAYGEVYEASDRDERDAPSQRLAIKLLRRSDAQALYRFKREFRALAEVSHPNIVALHELYLESEQAFFTMELVRGCDLLSYVRPAGRLDGARLLGALRGLSAGVAALHRGGRVHRDLKPSNVLVEPSGRVVVVDFGLVTALSESEPLQTEQGFVGTAGYAAPEQLSLGSIGPASDWYAVGTMIYEALSGQLPFDAPFAELVSLKTRGHAAQLGQVPTELTELAALSLRMLAPEPAARPRLTELESLLGEPLPVARDIDAARRPLVGRGPQLAWLARSFAEVERGARVCSIVTAPSGLGKTSLVEEFLEQISSQRRGVVLHGRCYVNEDVSYCAMDGLLDSLSHYLLALSEREANALVPRDAQALSQLFPVLLRVPSIAAAPPIRPAIDDPSRARDRGAKALRELLCRLSDRLPVILFVDDLQWDDPDSAWLLATILSEPEPPSLLFVGACRSQSTRPSHVLQVLESDPALRASLRWCALEPLGDSDLRELACSALGDDRDSAALDTVLEESGGHPLFALELVRRLRSAATSSEGVQQLSLDRAICARVAELSTPARKLLELCCVAGHRLKVRSTLRHVDAEVRDLRELSSLRLMSSSGVGASDTVEPYHDRIREAVLADMPGEAVRALRRALAVLLLAESEPRYELVVEHYQAAGEMREAARYALAAADEVGKVLALHRLPALLELAFEHAEPEQHAALHVRIGDACAVIGRTGEATRRYRAAAQLESDQERSWQLRRMAMSQAFRGGDHETGGVLLRELDRELGFPGVRLSVVGVLVSLWWHLCWLIFGSARMRATSVAPSANEQKRLELAWSTALGYSNTHVYRSQYYAATAFRLAVRQGHVAIYSALRATFAMASAIRAGRVRQKAEQEIAAATALAEAAGERATVQFVTLGSVAYQMYTSQFAAAHRTMSALLEQALADGEVGSYVRSFTYMAASPVFFWQGDLKRTRQHADDWIRRAREHADVHLEYGLRALAAYRYLCDDEGERAAAEWSLVAERFPLHTVHRSAIWGAFVGLYAERLDIAEHAYSLAARAFWRWSAHVASDRLLHVWTRGAIDAARLSGGDTRLRLRLRLRLATLRLRLERGGSSSPQLHHLLAVLAFRGGRVAAGLRHLERTQRAFCEREMPLFAACASLALARLHSDPAKRARQGAAAAALFEREGLVRPDRWERALLPGLPDLPAELMRPSTVRAEL